MSTPVIITAPTRIEGRWEYGQPDGQQPIILDFEAGMAEAQSIPSGLRAYLEKKGFTVEDVDPSGISPDAPVIPDPAFERN